MRCVRGLYLALTFALVTGCGADDNAEFDGGTTSTSATGDRSIPLVVDTDLAGDDIVALAYLVADPRVDLLAVSVSGTGEVTCPRGAEIATALLVELERPNVSVACGAAEPLSGDRRFPSAWRAAADDAWELELPAVIIPDDAPDAVALLTERISAMTRPVTVLTLGPLTNVAHMLTERPDLIPTIDRVVVMGGAVNVPGNVQLDDAVAPLGAEWNLYIDPQAADIVVASGLPVTLVALDATNGVPVTDRAIELLKSNDVTAATAMARHVFERFPPPYMWDPLAAIAVTDPDLLPSTVVTIEVVTEGPDSGRTIERIGGSEVAIPKAPDDPEAIVTHLVQVLAGRDHDPLVSAASPPTPGTTTTPTTPTAIGDVTIGFDGTVCRYEGPERPAEGTYLVDLRPGPVQFWGVIALVLPGTTMEDAAAWIAEHPAQRPPMIEEVVTIGEDVLEPPGSVEFRAGTVGVACLTEDGTIHVAVTLEVAL